jgi:tRNA nucleotidyltransferase (CCA-adding enzyme)
VPSPLNADLVRRDFTINAMALQLAGASPGSLVDPTDGLVDLEANTIRVIHQGSFVDDATRILRGLRLASRLWFDVEPKTRRLMSSQAHHLDDISGSRLRTELTYLLTDARPWRSLQQAADLEVLGALVQGLTWDERRSSIARRVSGPSAEDRAWRLLASLASTLDNEGAALFAERFSLGGRERRIVLQAVQAASSLAEREQATVELALRLSKLEPVVVSTLAELFLTTDEANRLARFLAARPELRGDDLIALGVLEGPAVGRLLDELRRAAMSGAVSSRSDELALARTLIKKQLDSKSES